LQTVPCASKGILAGASVAGDVRPMWSSMSVYQINKLLYLTDNDPVFRKRMLEDAEWLSVNSVLLRKSAMR